MDGQKDRQTDGRTDGHINGRTKELTDGRTYPFGEMIGRIGKLLHALHVFLLSHKSKRVAVLVSS